MAAVPPLGSPNQGHSPNFFSKHKGEILIGTIGAVVCATAAAIFWPVGVGLLAVWVIGQAAASLSKTDTKVEAVAIAQGVKPRELRTVADFKPAVKAFYEGKRPRTEEDATDQMRKDKLRMKGVDPEKVSAALRLEEEETTRKNILYANSQRFETDIGVWSTGLFGSSKDFAVMQLPSDNPLKPRLSKIDSDYKKRTTTLTSQLQARRFTPHPGEDPYDVKAAGGIQVEKFKITAVFHWDTAQVDVTKRPIRH